MQIFNDLEAENHFRHITEHKLSFRELIDSPVSSNNDLVTEAQPSTVPAHLEADTTDQTFQQPVRMHGVEGPRDISQPFKANRKWHLEMGNDGRPAIVGGEQATGKMKLSYDYEHGVILIPADEPTIRPSWKRLDQKHYPGNP